MTQFGESDLTAALNEYEYANQLYYIGLYVKTKPD